MMKIHKTLTPERWFQFSLMEQLANVGTDVERAMQWKKAGNLDYSQKAFERALELLYYTIADPKNVKRGALRELCRMREVLIDYFVGDNEYGSSDELWSSYFYAFNYAAAIEKGR
jgi:hypothetical protein